MPAPLVTVAIPTYNRPEFLREALASVLSQDFQDFEVLVLDDASPCDMRSVVRSFNDRRIRFLRQARNIGVIWNSRAALSLPGTRYVAHLDDDDLWLPHHLGEAIAALEHCPEAKFYACTAREFGTRVGLHRPAWCAPDALEVCRWQETGYGVWLMGSCIQDSSVVVRRDALDGLYWGGKSWPWCHDWLWWGQLAIQGPFVFNSTVGVQYRWHSSNFTTQVMSSLRKAQWLFTLRELATRAWTVGALQNLESEIGEFTPSALSTILIALSAPESPPSLKRQALRIFTKHRALAAAPGCALHYRVASHVGGWWLCYADVCTRIQARWWPYGANRKPTKHTLSLESLVASA